MAKTKISEYDAISANNTDVDSINIAEGCAPSGINNAIREVMAHLKDFQTGASGDSLTVGGTLTSGTVDINGGAIDGATVGATTPSTGSFTNLTASGTVSIPDNAISGDKVEGGTINAITINTLTSGALTATTSATLQHSASTKLATTATGIDVTGLTDTDTLNVSGNTTLGDASTDTVTVNGYMGVGGAGTTSTSVLALSDSLGTTTQRGFASGIVGSASATTAIVGFNAYNNTAATAFTCADVIGFRAQVGSKGAGSTVTNWHGVYVQDQTQGTNNYGITSTVSSGTNKWNIYASGTAANYFAGSVGVGKSSPSRKLHVYDTGSIPVRFETNTSDTKIEILTTSGTQFIQGSANNLLFGTNSAERARITSAGELLVGTTSVSPFDEGARFLPANSGSKMTLVVSNTGGGTPFILNTTADTSITSYRRSGTQVGSITVTATTTAYNTSSDYRLKEDWQPMTGASERVKALKPVNFAWKADGSRVDGFLAHEAQAVVPEAVTGTKDAVDAEGNPVYQGIDQSKLLPVVVAALQEALAQIESLTARVSALEGN